MITKQFLREKFSKEYQKFYQIEILKERGFVRKICKNCGKGFWTLDDKRETCPDPSCGEKYGFIGNPITKKKFDYIETWKTYEKFFVKNGHTSVERYPVVCRWREDLFFTIASIQDFQRLEGGKVVFEYPANPLIVPQVCLRFADIQNVGITGRHHTSFIMSGQHAFNYPKEGYWKDRCIELNFNFLTKEMGIPEEELIYTEDIWAMPDFSAFGPCIETFSRGLELVNSVFMQFRATNSGYEELPIKVIDVGWGHERLVWFSNGTPTGYDCVFGPIVKKLIDESGIEYDKEFMRSFGEVAGKLDIGDVKDINVEMEKIAKSLNISVKELKEKLLPLQALYSIADHSKTLLFAIVDGGLPSNIGGGYNLRVILRRTLSLMEKLKLNIKLYDVILWHIDFLKPLFLELRGHEEEIKTILEIEQKRYKESRIRAKKIVKSLLEKRKKLEEKDLITLYKSEGISPEMLREEGLELEIPSNFYLKITEKIGERRKEEDIGVDVESIPPTQILFYDDIFKFKAKVLKVLGEWVVLDRTAFYPTSGGQLHDKGLINGLRVEDVRKIGDVVLHKVIGSLKEGEEVDCIVDMERRIKITRHHTATHIINYSARKVLGNWVWQHGAEKDEDKARLDITHFSRLEEEDVKKIEELANQIVEKNLPIKTEILPRGEAEKKYGFRIYQGGAIPSREVRIISIDDFDHQACCGTHCKSTGEVGFILILRTKRIADGLVRIEFCSGENALKMLREKASILEEVSKKLKVSEEKVVEAVDEIFKRWKKLRKELRKK